MSEKAGIAQAQTEWALLSADTDKIKEYVFESAKLPEIRGASMILDDLNWGYEGNKRQVPAVAKRTIGDIFLDKGLSLEQWPTGCLIYAGGGSLVAVVPLHRADELKREIEALYPRETGVATITCVWRPVTQEELEHGLGGYALQDVLALREKLTPKEWQRIAVYYHGPDEAGDEISEKQFARRKNLSELIALQARELREAKGSKTITPLIEAVPYARRCEACEIRPAATHVDEPQPRYLCRVCEHKFGPEERRKRKNTWVQRFEGYLDKNPETTRRYLGGLSFAEVQAALDLSEIGSAAAGGAEGYVGFIYVDGNRIGGQVERSAGLGEYQDKSTALKIELPKLVYEALGKHLVVKKNVPRKDKQGKSIRVHIHPFEIIAIGGDDLLLIIPGDRALPIAWYICNAFQTNERLTGLFREPTMSAGVVIADSHTPIYFLRDLADQLLKSAKKRARELKPPEGTVDFLVLKSQTTLATNVSHLRDMPPLFFTDRERKENLYLTGRPYPLTELSKLMESVQDLQGFPGSQLQGYRRALLGGRFRAMFHFLYQYARATEAQRKILRRIFDRWRRTGSADPQPWFTWKPQKGYARYWTPWADIGELIDFVPRRSQDEKGGERLESLD